MPTHVDRVQRLLVKQAAEPHLQDLLTREITYYELHSTANPGTSRVFYAELGDISAIHKPHVGLRTSIAHDYRQSTDTPPMHECVAWLLAQALGSPFADLVPPVAYRRCEGEWGSLALQIQGDPATPAPKTQAPDAVLAAGLFDALIGQQDRNVGNFRWDASVRRLWIIDHGFAFPEQGHPVRNAYFQKHRRKTQAALTDKERHMVEALAASDDLFGVEPLLEEARAERLRWRAQRMAELGVILAKGVV